MSDHRTLFKLRKWSLNINSVNFCHMKLSVKWVVNGGYNHLWFVPRGTTNKRDLGNWKNIKNRHQIICVEVIEGFNGRRFGFWIILFWAESESDLFSNQNYNMGKWSGIFYYLKIQFSSLFHVTKNMNHESNLFHH